jgi:tRNA-dihydrouridine synthase B
MKYYLAPMEAVNCASFRILCLRRGADLIYTDMIDADVFVEYIKKHSEKEAVLKYINPQKEEIESKKLVVQIGGANVANMKTLISAVKDFTIEINWNLGCPLGYMLGKKGGVYLQKHTAQLYPKITELVEHCTSHNLPFTIKIRSGWDKESINAAELCIEAEKLGVSAIAVHPRTRKQRYQDKADWLLVAKCKKAVSKIPIILSGDITNYTRAQKAAEITNCDAMMIGRAAQVNPSVFTQIKKPSEQSDKIYEKYSANPKRDFLEWLALYNTVEQRHKISEIKDHALWTANECKGAKDVKQTLLACETEEAIVEIIESISFKI